MKVSWLKPDLSILYMHVTRSMWIAASHSRLELSTKSEFLWKPISPVEWVSKILIHGEDPSVSPHIKY